VKRFAIAANASDVGLNGGNDLRAKRRTLCCAKLASPARAPPQRHARAVAKSKGSGTMPGVKRFGQPITRAQYAQLRQRYNDLFRAWLGRADSILLQTLDRSLGKQLVDVVDPVGHG